MEQKTNRTHIVNWMSARGRGVFAASFDKPITAEDKLELRKTAMKKSAEGKSEFEKLFPRWSSLDNVFSISISISISKV